MQLLIIKADSANFSKGDIVEVRGSSTPFGGAEPNSFVLVEVPDVPMAAWEQYGNKHWRTNLQWEVVASNLAQDGYRIRIWSDTYRAGDGKGATAREHIEQFINRWGGSVVDFAANQVRFDIRIIDAIQSTEFWDWPDLTGVVFTEQDYNQTTGVHRVQMDYSAVPTNPTSVERRAVNLGATIISHQGRVLVMDIDRADVRKQFIEDIQRGGKQNVERFRYRITSAAVDAVIAAGGTMTTDAATLMTYLRDKVAD